MMALLAALGAGYMGHKAGEKDRERQDKKDAREEEEYQFKKSERERAKADQSAVADTYGATQSEAYTPAQGQELEAIASAKDPQGNPYYSVGNDATGKYTVAPNFQNETGEKPQAYAPATIAAKGVNYLGKSYDQPLTDEQATGARRTRIADLAAQGSAAASTSIDREQKAVKFDQEQEDRVKLLQKENIFEVEEAMRKGDAAGVKERMNRSGQYKIVGDVTMTPEKRTIPNHGDIDTFTYTFELQTPDGKVQKATKNSFDVSTQIMPYAKQIEEMRKGAELDRKIKNDEGDLKIKQQNADTNKQYREDMVAERRAATAARIASGGAGGGGGGAAPGVSLKDRRDFLADTASFLEDPKTAGDPLEATAMQRRNEQTLANADAIFSTNAEFGNVLTAPQARAAMQLAQDPKNVRTIRDNNTGQYYETVQVNGKGVVLGVGTARQAPSPTATAGKPAAPIEPQKTSAPSGPKEGDTRTISNGRGNGVSTEVYKRTGRSGSQLTWVKQ